MVDEIPVSDGRKYLRLLFLVCRVFPCILGVINRKDYNPSSHFLRQHEVSDCKKYLVMGFPVSLLRFFTSSETDHPVTFHDFRLLSFSSSIYE